jgi:hypothetical protein
MLYSSPSASSTITFDGPGNLAAEGSHLRDALVLWQLQYQFTPGMESLGTYGSEAGPGQIDLDHVVLSNIFFSAASIYLSGNFDYNLSFWHSLNIQNPILSRDDILQHVWTILAFVRLALKNTCLSPLLFLFPLRIAGARVRSLEQRDTIIELLQLVATQFAVARQFISELKELWQHGSPHIAPSNI